MLTIVKKGRSKLPLDRVPALAEALDVDPRYLLRLALDQAGLETSDNAIDAVLGTVVSRREVEWLEELRDASDHTDPPLSLRARRTLRSIFGK